MSDLCLFVALAPLALGVIYGVTASFGIATQVAGNAIMHRIGAENYASTALAVNIGLLGGAEGFILGIPGAFAIIAFIPGAAFVPIVALPILVIGGVITGLSGFYIMRDHWQWDELGTYGVQEAVRAGALGTTVVCGLLLLSVSIFLALGVGSCEVGRGLKHLYWRIRDARKQRNESKKGSDV